jgi:recombination protein RecA
MSPTVKNGPSDDQMKALSVALGQIEKKHGKNSVIDMSKDPEPVQSTPTGSLPLDIALGIGGIPVGRIMEVFGPESSGKTTLCYHLIAEVQKAGGIAAFIDTEHSMDAIYAARVGVDMDHLVVSQPDSGEQALDIVEVLVSSGAVQLIVVDSVAALTPRAELEGEMSDQNVGLQARMMSKACRKLAGPAARNNTTIVFTNQIREKVGVMFGSPETQPGGRALKFYASVRLDIRRIETVKDGQEAVGNRVRVKVVKNKVAAPFRQAEFMITFGEGFDREASLLDFGQESDIALVEKAGAFFTFVSTGEKSQGQAKAKVYLKENPAVADEIELKVRQVKLGQHLGVAEVIGAGGEPATAAEATGAVRANEDDPEAS